LAKQLIQSLADSKIYQEYERAFTTATRMSLALRPVDPWQLPHHGQTLENPFCALLSQTNAACTACLQVQKQLAETATRGPQTVICQAGLCETAVPVLRGDQLIGFLTTGQVFLKKPTAAQYRRTVKLLTDWGVPHTENQLHGLYFGTRVLSAREQAAVIQLLTIFAQHLSLVSNQIVVQEECAEQPVITRAKRYIYEHQAEKLPLARVAKAMNMTIWSFCKAFSKTTGIHFTDYLGRTRTERSKHLLLNPNLRVSEIAYEAGFQSLTHFNRVFKRIEGHSPTDHREQLARGWGGAAKRNDSGAADAIMGDR
jgi:AraC-like DNA-binding protein/ligand-binding sensor protein